MSTTDSQRGPARDVDSQEAARRESIEVNERRVVRMREAMTYYRDKMHEAMANRRTDEGDCHCDIPMTDARRPTHCHLCGRKKRLPSGFINSAIERKPMIDQIERRVVIDYTNYRNERKMYEIEPKSIFFGSNNWHHERQWLMAADVFRNDGKEVSSQSRTFAMCKIHQMWKASHD